MIRVRGSRPALNLSRFTASALLTLALFCAESAAQVSTAAALTGIVTDPSQARVPQASVQLTNEQTGVSVTTQTDSQGEYTFALLSPAPYRLAAEAQGFRRYSRSGIVLEIGRVTRLDFSMDLGQVAEVVEVGGSAPLLESESAVVSQFVENKTIIDMPLRGRRVGDLVTLMGNTFLIRTDLVNFPRIAVAGGRGDGQMWLLDGVTAQNLALEGPQTNFNPPVEAIQEFRVLQNNYSAEYGNTSSGVISFSTRSGTNKLHGSVYEFFRNDKLDARNFFSATKAPLRWNIFGFAVGGPIKKNRTFFFVNNEWAIQRVGLTRLLTVPTERQRNGDFSQTVTNAGALIPVYDPNTTRLDPATGNRIRELFPGNIIPPGRIDAVGRNLAALFPLPNRAATNLAGADNFGANAGMKFDFSTLSAKVDHVFSEKDRLSGRFVWYHMPDETTPALPQNQAADPFNGVNKRNEYSLLINEIHNFSSRVINDFRFDWQPREFKHLSLGLGEGWPTKIGLKGVPDRAFPRFNMPGYASLGTANQERIQVPIHDTHIVNHLSWLRGSHAAKFGGELRLARNVDDLRARISGVFDFGQQPTAQPGVGNTGNSIASLLLGFPNVGDILSTDLLDRRAKYFALFAQDDWKVTSNFTLNLGVRWEAHTPRFDEKNRQNGFDPFAINPVSNTPGVITFAGVGGQGRNVYDGDFNNIGPRVGLAWKPFGNAKTVIRSGYGIFFGPPIPGSNNASAGFQTSGNFSTPDNGLTAPFLLRDGLPSTSREQLGPGFGAVPVGQPVRYAPEFIARERRLGYSQQWNFGVQRDLGGEVLVEVTYLGNVSHKLPGPNTNVNQVPVALMGPGNAQVRRALPQFGNVTMLTPMWGNSSYHSLNVKLEKRFSRGLNFLANYTYSKFLDDVPAGSELGGVGGGMQNYYNRRDEKSLAGNDIRNRFVWSSVYELPVGKGRHWLNRGTRSVILGGWNLGAIISMQSGSPVGLVTQTNTTNAFTPGSQRVNLLRDPTLPQSERRVERWFDTTAAVAPQPFTFGTAGRANIIGPGLADVDVSLLKNQRWGEAYNIQFRFEAQALVRCVECSSACDLVGNRLSEGA